MSWNHRILAHEYNGDVYLQIHEVYYNENNEPDAYTDRPVSIGGEDVKEITWTLNKMLSCRNKPILWADERFPQECKITYKCDLCGKEHFQKPQPHDCLNGFRKRGMTWTIKYN